MDPIAYNSRMYMSDRSLQPESRVQIAKKLVGSGKTVLDVGCFDGTIAAEIAKAGNDVHGIDASETAVKAAREKGVKALLGDIGKDFPFADGMFDAVFAGEVVEHVFELRKMLSEVHRVLKPGGEFVVTTPNLAAFGRRILLLLGLNPLIEIDFYKPGAAGHIRYFVKNTLDSMLKETGFVPVIWKSDVVNFNAAGTISSSMLARIFPSIGRTLIVKARRI